MLSDHFYHHQTLQNSKYIFMINGETFKEICKLQKEANCYLYHGDTLTNHRSASGGAFTVIREIKKYL